MAEYNLILHNTGIRKLFSFTNIYQKHFLPLNYCKYNMISLYYLILNASLLVGSVLLIFLVLCVVLFVFTW